ncbi:MAG: response regulator transcription factor [Paludibacteraceae bacterium]
MNKNDVLLKIAIAEPSTIIRTGLATTLKRVQGFHVHAIEVASPDLLWGTIRLYKPDVIIINPIYLPITSIAKIKQEYADKSIQILAILTGFFDTALKLNYDETIDLYDSAEQIQHKLEKLFNDPDAEVDTSDEADALSLREKEILTCVVKGLTNKEIANELFLSTHTVITHRRNIIRKLGIHSTAGLTIYAITNKLIDIQSINQNE